MHIKVSKINAKEIGGKGGRGGGVRVRVCVGGCAVRVQCGIYMCVVCVWCVWMLCSLCGWRGVPGAVVCACVCVGSVGVVPV